MVQDKVKDSYKQKALDYLHLLENKGYKRPWVSEQLGYEKYYITQQLSRSNFNQTLYELIKNFYEAKVLGISNVAAVKGKQFQPDDDLVSDLRRQLSLCHELIDLQRQEISRLKQLLPAS